MDALPSISFCSSFEFNHLTRDCSRIAATCRKGYQQLSSLSRAMPVAGWRVA
jgi:hypothetical protein